MIGGAWIGVNSHYGKTDKEKRAVRYNYDARYTG